jgi:hypothetical protein
MNRFYSLDIKTQFLLQDSVRRDSFKNLTTKDGVQWLLWSFYHWGIKYLSYDSKNGLLLFHSRPVYDEVTKQWYGNKVMTHSESEGTTEGNGDNHGDDSNNSINGSGDTTATEGNVSSEVSNTVGDIHDSNGEGVNHVGNDIMFNTTSSGVVVGDFSRDMGTEDSIHLSDSMGIRHILLGVNANSSGYNHVGNEPKSLSFYIYSLITSVYELKEGSCIELTTKAIEDDIASGVLKDGMVVEVSNNGITWFKRYFKSIVPNLSTSYCVYGGGRTKDTVRDTADVEYYNYLRYVESQGTTCNHTCGNGCSTCNVKHEGTRNTIDGRGVFVNRGIIEE